MPATRRDYLSVLDMRRRSILHEFMLAFSANADQPVGAALALTRGGERVVAGLARRYHYDDLGGLDMFLDTSLLPEPPHANAPAPAQDVRPFLQFVADAPPAPQSWSARERKRTMLLADLAREELGIVPAVQGPA